MAQPERETGRSTTPATEDWLAAVGLDEAIGADRFHPTVRAAITACHEADGPRPRA